MRTVTCKCNCKLYTIVHDYLFKARHEEVLAEEASPASRVVVQRLVSTHVEAVSQDLVVPLLTLVLAVVEAAHGNGARVGIDREVEGSEQWRRLAVACVEVVDLALSEIGAIASV